MEWSYKNGLFLRDGHYLVPRTPDELVNDAYALGDKVLASDRERYTEKPPLILPLTRGGTSIYPMVVSAFRDVTHAGHGITVRYVTIEVKRYNEGRMGSKGSSIYVNDFDIAQALSVLEDHDDALIIDDVLDEGHSIEKVREKLSISKKRLIAAVLDKKPKKRQVASDADFWVRTFDEEKEVDGTKYDPWLVYPWERNEHPRDLWHRLFPMLP